MENSPDTVPAARSRRVRKHGRVSFIVVMLLVVLAAGGAYLLVMRPWQPAAQFDPQSGEISELSGRDGRGDLLGQQRQQLQRMQLNEVIWLGDKISQDIEALQSEIDAYQKGVKELMASDAGDRLLKDKEVVRYLRDQWGEPLPHEEVAKQCRGQLEVLLLPLRDTVAKPDGGFDVSPETIQEIERLRMEVTQAKGQYTRQRQLVEALANGGSRETSEHVGGVDDLPPVMQDALNSRKSEDRLGVESGEAGREETNGS